MTNQHKNKLSSAFAAVILAAGKGTRMRSGLPKVLHKLAGTPLVNHVLSAVAPLSPERLIVVVGQGSESVEKTVKAHSVAATCVLQSEQLGTGHAVNVAAPELANYSGHVLVLYGDTPLITTATLRTLCEASSTADVVVLGMHLDTPTGYGRLLQNAAGDLVGIVEEKDASDAQKTITLCNSGILMVRAASLFGWLSQLRPNNAAGEYYLTDIIGLAAAEGKQCRVVTAPAAELAGINTRAQLAQAEVALQDRLRARAMEQGATLIDPASIFLSADTQLGEDVVVHPHVVFGAHVVVEDGAEIRSFSHIEGAHIGRSAIVGPFARVRPGSVVGAAAHVGNFVELKNTQLGAGAKANHLSYVGDSIVGAGANIGAGTITCNYDGVNKHKTFIGEGAFIGSNSSLVAPVSIGAGARVGAGSVITENVPDGALALGRAHQVIKPKK
jgi:bifunctional UDP-N-acetylglucosamine pyrophosphorylase / glucosamine-1-phosphate N-acetyltransferase